MDRDLVAARLSRLATRVGSQWLKSVGALLDSGELNKLPIPKQAERLMSMLSEATETTLDVALAELAKNVPRASRDWGWAHDEATRIFQSRVAEYFTQISGLLRQPEETTKLMIGSPMAALLSNIPAVTSLHESGWSSPNIEPWIKRNAYWISILISVIALAVSIFRDDLRNSVVGLRHHSSQPGIESQPSPGTLASASGDR